MNEKKVIQGLDNCKHNKPCINCPYFSIKSIKCREQLIDDALELIRQKNEEINELTHKHHNEAGQLAKYSDELHQIKSKNIFNRIKNIFKR